MKIKFYYTLTVLFALSTPHFTMADDCEVPEEECSTLSAVETTIETGPSPF